MYSATGSSTGIVLLILTLVGSTVAVVDQAAGQQDNPTDSSDAEWIVDPAALLAHLKRRDAELETMKHPRYTAIENSGHRWSSVGGVQRSYSPQTKSLHLMGKPKPGTLLSSNRRKFQWCCGYGFARQMETIDSVRVERKRLLIKGKTRLMGYDDSRIELELDGDYIVRHASVFVPVQNGDGGNLYVVETDGTVRPTDSPPLARTGHFKRILQPGGKPERVYREMDVDFVSVSGKLTDPPYSQQTKIDPVDGVSVIDFRPRSQR